MIFAGIGSRKIPNNVQTLMSKLAKVLMDKGHMLRSGHAEGADMAFECAMEPEHRAEIYLPWRGFNQAPTDDSRYIVPSFHTGMMGIAQKHHPNWNACSDGAKKLHARNVCQVLGKDLTIWSDIVICWTPNGSGSGGTGQAIRIARSYGIPVFDLGLSNTREHLFDHLETWV